MNKIEEAKEILKKLQEPVKQQADLCCFVLLAMANIKEQDKWSNATNSWIRIHDVIAYTKENYGVTYAENSRETFRKQAMHHFRNAAFIEDNGKATNSPNYRYRLTDEMLSLIRSYGTAYWESEKQRFLQSHETLIDLYASKRTMRKSLFGLTVKTLHSLPVSTTNFKKLSLKNLLHVLLPIPSAFM